MKNIAQMIDPGTDYAPESTEINIEHLDYGYVATCNDKRELYKLLDCLKYFVF